MPTYSLTIPFWLPLGCDVRADGRLLGLYAVKAGIPQAAGPRQVSLVLTGTRGKLCGERLARCTCAVVGALARAGLLVSAGQRHVVVGQVLAEHSEAWWATQIVLEDLHELPDAPPGGRRRGCQKTKRQPGKTYLHPRHRRG